MDGDIPRDHIEAGPSVSKHSTIVHHNVHHVLSTIQLRHLPVLKEGSNGKSVHTFAFLDDGSSSTFMEEGTANKIGVDDPSDPFWLSWTRNASREEKDSKRVSVMISGCEMGNRCAKASSPTADVTI